MRLFNVLNNPNGSTLYGELQTGESQRNTVSVLVIILPFIIMLAFTPDGEAPVDVKSKNYHHCLCTSILLDHAEELK